MVDAKTIPAKYIFLDVVGFSQDRSVEAQTDIVHSMNVIVKTAVIDNGIVAEKVIYLPTGDGICIAILNVEDPYDIHVRVALDILNELELYNEGTEDPKRKFKVRIGINANTDNLVTDINGSKNIAGAGVNVAQRVMSLADGNQLLVSQAVFDTLHVREAYMPLFRSYATKVKHGMALQVHQLISEESPGLDTSVPQALKTVERIEPKLSLITACYFALAIKHREFFLQHRQGLFATKVISLWMLAGDSAREIEAGGLASYIKKTVIDYTIHDPNNLELDTNPSFENLYDYYSKLDEGVATEFAELITFGHLFKYNGYFEGYMCWLINSRGIEKLKREWRDVWDKFSLGGEIESTP